MTKLSTGTGHSHRMTSFGNLFKKYRLRSEIETLAEFGDLLAEEGIIYENSLFTRWQNGERVPTDRKVLLTIITVFVKRKGIQTSQQANLLMEHAQQGNLTEFEVQLFPTLTNESTFKTPQPSLGGLLKDYRLQKNLSQIEVSITCGWSDISYLEKIELGQIERPSSEEIVKICNALQLKDHERNYVLLTGNYLPSDEEIEVVREKVKPIIEAWPYPAVMYDFCWRSILLNSKNIRMLQLTAEQRQLIHDTKPCALEIVFDPNFWPNKFLRDEELNKWHRNLFRFVLHFKNLHRSINKDEWYQGIITKMMKNELFSKVWNKTDDASLRPLTTRYGEKVLINPKDFSKRLNFHIFVVPLADDPRFELEYFSPADKETFTYFRT